MMVENAGIAVNTGSLTLDGTATDRITVRGEVETPGYWEMLNYRSNNPGNILRFADVSHGGSGASFGFSGNIESSVLVTNGGEVTTEDSTINESEDAGVTVQPTGEFGSFA
ncbi:MAG: hypothetical protein AAF219_10485 [Myxococcota bacterium]